MLNFKEYPRNGVSNKPIRNPGESHLPCVVLVDTSGSMQSVANQLIQGLAQLSDALHEDPMALGRVELCIIAFDDTARILVPFSSVYDYQPPEFDCGGKTAMHAAVDMALEEIEARKAQYGETVPYYRPWIYMLTDGGANDDDNGAFDRLRRAQDEKHCTFYPVGIGEYFDAELLKSLSRSGTVLSADKNNFLGSFTWLSDSLSRVSNSTSNASVPLDDPANHQLAVIS